MSKRLTMPTKITCISIWDQHVFQRGGRRTMMCGSWSPRIQHEFCMGDAPVRREYLFQYFDNLMYNICSVVFFHHIFNLLYCCIDIISNAVNLGHNTESLILCLTNSIVYICDLFLISFLQSWLKGDNWKYAIRVELC